MRALAVCFAVVALAAPMRVGAGSGAARVVDTGIDPDLPRYEAVEGVSGVVKSVGSDTMINLMTLWGEDFKNAYPAVQVEVAGKGSSTAPPALIGGSSQFGPMSRAMKPTEIGEFVKSYGYEPTALRAAVDCLAMYVHKDCPLDSITLEQIQMLFSTDGPAMTWDQLGVEDLRYRGRPVTLYGRNSASGTYGYFKKVALAGHDFKPTVKEQPGSSSVVQAVATDPYGMGYSGIGFRNANVKILPISDGMGEAFAPTSEHAFDGLYPLARFLYVYINYDERVGLDPLRAEFVRLMFSQQGQESVLKDGYIAISAEIAREDLVRVGLEPGF